MKKILTLLIMILLWAAVLANDLYRMDNIDIIPEDEHTRITVSGTGYLQYSTYEMNNPKRIALDIYDAVMPDKPLVYDYCPPIKRISLQPIYNRDNSIRMIVEYNEKADYVITKTSNFLSIEFTNPADKKLTQDTKKDKPAWMKKKINLVIEEGQVSSALNLISRKADFDLVISDIDEKSIWVNLQKVPAGDALQAILNASGNTCFITGSLVVVSGYSGKRQDGMETQIYRLKYIDAVSFVDAVSEILSPNAKIKTLNTNSSSGGSANEPVRFLLATDTPEKHEMIKNIISQVDNPPKQVTISVKFIETNITGEKTLGIDWNKMVEAKLTGLDPFGGDSESASSGNLSAYSSWPPEKGTFVYGTLTIREATAALNYLHDSGKSKLLSDPSVTTSDGKKAVISVSTTIPIQTINRLSEGSVIQDIVTYDYKEVGIKLSVTPRLNEQGRITLICEPTVEEITNWVGPSTNQQPITTKRQVETEVVVADGETVVIGGLYKESSINTESKIWLLGDIPILGYLFKTKTTNKTKTDLMIFITPKIIE